MVSSTFRFHPIRHAADVKPYASDLLVALVLGRDGWRLIRAYPAGSAPAG